MDKRIINALEKEISKNQELSLNHIYDMGNNWLFSIKTKKEKDLMDPYYIADKKTLKVTNFSFQEDLPGFNAALKKMVY